MAAHQKKVSRLGAHLVFVDESGFLLIPSVYKTWAPRGQTPLLFHRQRRDRISVISGLFVSPRRRRLGLYYCLHAKNIQHPEVRAFVRHLLRHLRGPVVLVWDNGSIHKGDAIRALCSVFPRLHLYRFPGYAPELNPDEGVWKLAKHALANGRPDTQQELWRHLRSSLERIRWSSRRLRGCIRQSDLPFFCARHNIIYAVVNIGEHFTARSRSRERPEPPLADSAPPGTHRWRPTRIRAYARLRSCVLISLVDTTALAVRRHRAQGAIFRIGSSRTVA